MLGFDAIGRFALGQIGQAGVSTITLSAVTGAITVSGQTALFKYLAPHSAGSYSVAGNMAGMNTKLLGAGTSYATGWVGASFRVGMTSAPAGYVVTGYPATLGAGGLPAATGVYSVAGMPAYFRIGLVSVGGAYNVVGVDAGYTLIRESWYPTPGQSEDWTEQPVQSEIWTPATIQSEGWTNIPAP